jgi:hypothetical protein
MASNTAIIKVGRLLEIRADAGYRTAQEVDVLFDTIEREVDKLPLTNKHVTVVDWRRCPIMAPEAAERIAARIAGVNDRTERSAAIASKDSATAVLQFLRVIRDAKLPDRKLFFEESELSEWLAEVLTGFELRRLRDFLTEMRAA